MARASDGALAGANAAREMREVGSRAGLREDINSP